MRRLFIAEKPSMGTALAKGLESLGTKSSRGDGCIYVGSDTVTWLFGHILEQFSPSDYDEKYAKWSVEHLPIRPTKWKLKVKPSAKKQYNIVKKLAQEADVIVNAGDPDREGQLLVDELLNHVGVLQEKKIERILLNALDETSIREALKEIRPNSEFSGLRNSALARQRADWLIGMNLSRIYTILAQKVGYSATISVGRVKTPTLGLIVRREIEHRKFQPKTFYTPELLLHHTNGDFVAKWKKDDRAGLDAEGHILDKTVAEKILADASATQNLRITKVEQKEGRSAQRRPFSLSSLQMEAGKLTGFSPQKILDIQQALYEKKLTSYPRSDCTYLPENQFQDAKEILAHLAEQPASFAAFAQGTDLTIKSRAWNDKKVTAHHAIIPTMQKASLPSLTDDERIMYAIIAKSYIAQFYPEQKFLTTNVEVQSARETFRASGTVILQDGWKTIYAKDTASTEERTSNLPRIAEGDNATFVNGRIVAGKTTPPARFTGATLIQAMKEIAKYVHNKTLAQKLKECAGIGTEATRAGMIEELEKKGFIEKKGKYFVPSDLALTVCKILPERLLYPDLTAQWEDALDKISRREMSIKDFNAEQEIFLDELLTNAKNLVIPPPKNQPRCPKCRRPLLRRKGKKGYFWSCSGYPDCKTAFDDNRGQPGREWTMRQ